MICHFVNLKLIIIAIQILVWFQFLTLAGEYSYVIILASVGTRLIDNDHKYLSSACGKDIIKQLQHQQKHCNTTAIHVP